MALRIAIVGERGSGKDSVGEYLAQHYGCQPIAIAAPIKAAVYAALDAAGVDRSRKGAIRKAMQDAGWMAREIDSDIWLRSLIERHGLACEGQAVGFVVTDARYANECAALRACGFKIVRITAPAELRKARSIARGDGEWVEADSLHPSELAQRAIQHDEVIENDASLEVLYRKVEAMVTRLRDRDTDYVHA